MNVPSAVRAEARENNQDDSSISSIETTRPITGESTMAEVVEVTPFHTIAPVPACIVPAPSSPPIKAWLDDEGIPRHQVMTFHVIAPTSAPKITCGVITSLSMMPLPTVSATFRPKVK